MALIAQMLNLYNPDKSPSISPVDLPHEHLVPMSVELCFTSKDYSGDKNRQPVDRRQAYCVPMVQTHWSRIIKVLSAKT